MVEMIPSGATRRMRFAWLSAMNRLPSRSVLTSMGRSMVAAVAGPPSPVDPAAPVPATVEMTPAVFTTRTRRFISSAM